MPSPFSLAVEPLPEMVRLGLPPAAAKESRLSLRRASLAASGVFGSPGVRFPKAPWAGEGVTAIRLRVSTSS